MRPTLLWSFYRNTTTCGAQSQSATIQSFSSISALGFFFLIFNSARSKSVIPGDGGGGSAQSDIKRSMEKPLKKGWLKKQRSIVKNWKPCYFVLRGNVLTYHKDDRESAVQVRN